MKSVIFKRISIQNFISIGETPVEFDYQMGVNLVTGHNHDSNSRNGIGKSAVFADALFFALFGQTLRPINKPMIANRRTDGRCRIELDFDVITSDGTDNYNLVRTLKPSKLYLTKNTEDISTNINRSTEELYKIINATPEVFRNCVIMSLNNTLPFMLQSKVDKRKFIEGILKLDVFGSMLLNVRRMINEQSRETEIKNVVLQEKKRTITSYQEQQRKHNEQRQAQIRELKRRIATNDAKITALLEKKDESKNIDIDEVRSKLTKIKDQQEKSADNIQVLIGNQARLNEQISALNKNIKTMKGKPKNCPTCLRPYEEHNQEAINAELQRLNDEKGIVTNQLDENDQFLATQNDIVKRCRAVTQKLTSTIEEWRQLESVKQTCDAQIKQLNEFNVHFDADIQKLVNSQDQMADLIVNVQQEAAAARQQLDSAQFVLEALEMCRFVVSEEGVKSYIIKKMLKMFNSRLAYYLTKLNANCRCSFNEYFEETIIDELGNEVSYANFSGGESKRIDLAMLFTFQDIRRLQADSSINVCIYDELFDSSLDQSGVAAVMELLKERSQKHGNSTYVITHRSESLKMVEDVSIIHLEKRNGITQIAHYETTV